jgi:hypothetical protein
MNPHRLRPHHRNELAYVWLVFKRIGFCKDLRFYLARVMLAKFKLRYEGKLKYMRKRMVCVFHGNLQLHPRGTGFLIPQQHAALMRHIRTATAYDRGTWRSYNNYKFALPKRIK